MKKTNQIFVILGVSGFIGSHLARYLIGSDDHTVVGVIRKNSNLYRLIDIIDKFHLEKIYTCISEDLPSIIDKIKPDVIINCAEPSSNLIKFKKNSIVLNNSLNIIKGIINSLKLNPKIELIHLCSSLIYEHSNTELKENSRIGPFSPRGEIKLSELKLLRKSSFEFGFRFKVARIFRAYGPYEQEDRLLCNLFKAIEYGEAIKLTQLDPYRDYIYIDDLIRGIFYLIKNDSNPNIEVNFSSGRQVSVWEIFNVVCNVSGKKPLISKIPYPATTLDRYSCKASNSYARALLGWSPQVSLEEGVVKTYNWWKRNNL